MYGIAAKTLVFTDNGFQEASRVLEGTKLWSGQKWVTVTSVKHKVSNICDLVTLQRGQIGIGYKQPLWCMTPKGPTYTTPRAGSALISSATCREVVYQTVDHDPDISYLMGFVSAFGVCLEPDSQIVTLTRAAELDLVLPVLQRIDPSARAYKKRADGQAAIYSPVIFDLVSSWWPETRTWPLIWECDKKCQAAYLRGIIDSAMSSVTSFHSIQLVMPPEIWEDVILLGCLLGVRLIAKAVRSYREEEHHLSFKKLIDLTEYTTAVGFSDLKIQSKFDLFSFQAKPHVYSYEPLLSFKNSEELQKKRPSLKAADRAVAALIEGKETQWVFSFNLGSDLPCVNIQTENNEPYQAGLFFVKPRK